MPEDFLQGASPRATELLIEEWSAHVDATDALDGLTAEQAGARPDGWPYSIAQQVAHMLFWQRHMHEELEKGEAVEVSTAAASWPDVAVEDWPRVRDDFLAILEKNKELARDADLLQRPYREGKSFSLGVKLLNMVTHDSYHLGQVVLMRRLLGAWPPPAGGDTW